MRQLLHSLRDMLSPVGQNRCAYIFAESNLFLGDFTQRANNVFIFIVDKAIGASMKLTVALCSQVNKCELVSHVRQTIFHSDASHWCSPLGTMNPDTKGQDNMKMLSPLVNANCLADVLG